MKWKNLYAILYNLALLLVVPASLCMMSCSDEVTSNAVTAEEEEEITLNVTFDDKQPDAATRAITAPVNDIYLYAYQGTTRKAANVRYTYNGSIWKAYSVKITWPSTGDMSIFGLSDSYKTVLLDSMTYR